MLPAIEAILTYGGLKSTVPPWQFAVGIQGMEREAAEGEDSTLFSRVIRGDDLVWKIYLFSEDCTLC